MSYTIEYNKAVFFTEKDGIKDYFLFVRQGDNNVRDCDTNLRSKSWYFEESGSEAELWKHIGKRAGSVEGGGLQRSLGWEETKRFTIEEYIKQYRGKIKNAKSLDTFFEKFSISAYMYKKDEFSLGRQDSKLKLEEFVNKYSMKEMGVDYYDKEKKHFVCNIDDIETLKDFLINMPKGYNDDFQSGFRIEKFVKGRRRRYY